MQTTPLILPDGKVASKDKQAKHTAETMGEECNESNCKAEGLPTCTEERENTALAKPGREQEQEEERVQFVSDASDQRPVVLHDEVQERPQKKSKRGRDPFEGLTPEEVGKRIEASIFGALDAGQIRMGRSFYSSDAEYEADQALSDAEYVRRYQYDD